MTRLQNNKLRGVNSSEISEMQTKLFQFLFKSTNQQINKSTNQQKNYTIFYQSNVIFYFKYNEINK
ncbi:MAG TPA: hypothetical protein PKY56_12670 [Candidatus Kapabacteria bacterium]|nr:hypothetical protein [Candidatus Kapabacteria bacterium]HPO61873.1 hypothetical protein [Candidatus Kapabacteria bacterium]